ncbi:chemokine-like protein TAFA-5 [Syngnathus acus]|uniref:chemokine-like protein TAFA-5 n=1 Tax=Syngnathus acus TaxID=161584 RepID=UPI001886321B|nr:chemokine-like protein TAFA-5 [Syngnathus acus]
MQLLRLLLTLAAAAAAGLAGSSCARSSGTASAKVRRAHARVHAYLTTGELRTGSCEVLTLERDGSHPRRSVARQTARCACVPGRMAGTTRGRPACVHAGIVLSRQWCEMSPCLDDEGCQALVDGSGWSCAQPGGRVKTTTVS